MYVKGLTLIKAKFNDAKSNNASQCLRLILTQF